MEAFAEGGIDYLDMIMLDYPGPDSDSIKGQWTAFEDFLASGKTRSLAVSNFNTEQLSTVVGMGGTVPALNQLPMGVGYSGVYEGFGLDRTIEENFNRGGIRIQAYSPLRGPGKTLSTCREIGQKYDKSAAQVALRWLVEKKYHHHYVEPESCAF
eukprot:gnl/TRDRNA2_/TRDRNA2_164908_c0_seq1.p1 gnl/TRDRNA2_/TRDRNA2_164908_c0~~gnl/TRDRNA2_/TRDRNA2_164908_c0_seq1.p1  ORF type:complete len:155 (+),score=22.37 gnl/TRDRNA2_/TRDRNA2_164908_c0_seq1:495-959(+)